MPTVPKVIAALFFAALGYFGGDLVKPLLPEGTRTGLLNETLAIIGLISGWWMSGARAGDSTRSGLGYGLTSAALLLFWGVFLFAGYEALQMSLGRRFDGPMEALQAMIGIGLKYFKMAATPEIVVTLFVGGLFGGWLTEWVAKRWS